MDDDGSVVNDVDWRANDDDSVVNDVDWRVNDDDHDVSDAGKRVNDDDHVVADDDDVMDDVVDVVSDVDGVVNGLRCKSGRAVGRRTVPADERGGPALRLRRPAADSTSQTAFCVGKLIGPAAQDAGRLSRLGGSGIEPTG